MLKSPVFTEKSFWPIFYKDLASARGRVLIQSPFLSSRRILDLSNRISRQVSRGVTICAFIQEPRFWSAERESLQLADSQRLAEVKTLVELLERMQVHVNMRANIHEKLAIFDQQVLWEGSLNILSHSSTKERMRRLTDTDEVARAIVQHSLDECSSCRENYTQFVSETSAVGLTRQLDKYRSEQKLTQTELARRCGMSQGRLSQVKAGTANITLTTFARMANELQLEPILIPRSLVPSVLRLLKQNLEER